jgi:hypothetical protein
VRVDAGLQALLFWSEYREATQVVPAECIVNMDETLLAFDAMGRRAFAIWGSKSVVIWTCGKEKSTVTVALLISVTGDKLKPFIIYRDKPSFIEYRQTIQMYLP